MIQNKSTAELYLLCSIAYGTLSARKKQVVRNHTDQLKRLEEVMNEIRAYADANGPDVVQHFPLRPEIAALIVDPTRGL